MQYIYGMKALDIRQEYLLPLPFRIFGFALLIIGSVLIIQGGIVLISSFTFSWGLPGGMLLLLLGALISLSHYRLGIDPFKKSYLEYTWVLGMKRGKEVPYEHIERIFVNRVLQSTRISSYTGHPHEVKEYLYKAFLKLSNGEKIHLDSDKSEEVLMNRIHGYRTSLGITA